MAAPFPSYTHHATYHENHLYSNPYYPPLPPEESRADHGRISTLFVAGLPDDVKPREVHNLFSRRPGFESSLLEFTGKGNQVVAFVTFVTHQAAVAAMNTLNGAVFDPETGDTLFIELARSNSRKRPNEFGPYRVIDRRSKLKESNNELISFGNNDETDNLNENENEYSAPTEQSAEIEAKNIRGPPNSHQEIVEGEITPCSTLFIANLGPVCTNEELKQVLSKYPGLQTVKMLRRGGMPVAFADFEDIESASAAMDGLQGTSLPSSAGSSMHLEYAKSKMRKS
ncbi:hypothetical protein LUZ60_013862 [Juncus effusus]|nr:hypothetical protein LUZ60_013862 [Juncus effusus]